MIKNWQSIFQYFFIQANDNKKEINWKCKNRQFIPHITNDICKEICVLKEIISCICIISEKNENFLLLSLASF